MQVLWSWIANLEQLKSKAGRQTSTLQGAENMTPHNWNMAFPKNGWLYQMHFQNKYQIWADPKEVSAWVQSDTSHPIWTSQLKNHPRLKILPWGWWDNLPVLQRIKEFTFKIKRQNANLQWKEMMIWIDNKTIKTLTQNSHYCDSAGDRPDNHKELANGSTIFVQDKQVMV
jgi:hypothetical protein